MQKKDGKKNTRTLSNLCQIRKSTTTTITNKKPNKMFFTFLGRTLNDKTINIKFKELI